MRVKRLRGRRVGLQLGAAREQDERLADRLQDVVGDEEDGDVEGHEEDGAALPAAHVAEDPERPIDAPGRAGLLRLDRL